MKIIQWCEENGWDTWNKSQIPDGKSNNAFSRLVREFTSIILCSDLNIDVLSIQKIEQITKLVHRNDINAQNMQTAKRCAEESAACLKKTSKPKQKVNPLFLWA